MLPGLRSRWTTPCRCASPIARPRVSTSLAASRGGRGDAVEPAGEAAAVDVLHLEVGKSVVLADVKDLDDVRVLEPGDRLGLGKEPGGSLADRRGAPPGSS